MCGALLEIRSNMTITTAVSWSQGSSNLKAPSLQSNSRPPQILMHCQNNTWEWDIYSILLNICI